jgi:hypothetical protein
MEISIIKIIILVIWALFDSLSSYGKNPDKRIQLASQFMSLAPNAGGQSVYSLRFSREKWEVSLFSNQTISAGGYPYSGIVAHRRFSICDASCFWQFYTATGVGGSNGGPIVEFTWSSIIPLIPLWLPLKAPSYFPAVRLDVTTQLVLIQWRAVTWTYPFWVGISVPI